MIDLHTDNPDHKRLLETTHLICRLAGLTQMPEIGIYPSSHVSASANGLANRILISSKALTPSFERGLEGLAHYLF